MGQSAAKSARSSGRPAARLEVPGLSPILSASLDAFYENGYHGTTVRDIARRAELTVPALYYHHENKQAILVALLDHSISAVTRACRAAVEQAPDSAAQRFDLLVRGLVQFMATYPKSAAMDSEIRSLTPENRRWYGARRRVVEQLLVDTIRDGVDEGDFRVTHPTDTARALLGMVQAIPTWFRPGGPVSASRLADRYVEIARNTVGDRRATHD